jgi:hypothetical protein
MHGQIVIARDVSKAVLPGDDTDLVTGPHRIRNERLHAPTPATGAVTIPLQQGRTGHLNLNCAAKARPLGCFRHPRHRSLCANSPPSVMHETNNHKQLCAASAARLYLSSSVLAPNPH